MLSRQGQLLSQQKVGRMKKRMLRRRNSCCDIIMSKANISVVTKGDYVVTIKAVESEISVPTEKYSVSTKNRREVR